MATPIPPRLAALLYRCAVIARGEGRVFQHLAEFEQHQWLTSDEIAWQQTQLLAEQLTFAQTHVPLYTAHIGNAVISIQTARAVHASLPLITKADLRDRALSLRARPPARRVTAKTTGGSTGQTVTVLKDRSATAHEMAATWLGYGWFGIHPGDRAVRWWGRGLTWRRRIRATAANVATNRQTFSAFAFNEDDLARYWRECLRFKPAYFYGYVSMLERFARFINAEGLDGSRLRLKLIVTTSEVLTPPVKQLLERTFGAPVQNEYGCGEVGPIAYECPSGSLHVMDGNLIVEILRADGMAASIGESGQVVVTDLRNRAQPLMRYALGDNAEVGPNCSCGRGLRTLARIWGRSYDFISGPNGEQFHGELFMYVFEDLHARGLGVDQFQLVQHKSGDLTLRVVQREPLAPAQLRAIRARVEELIPGTVLAIEQIQDIPRAASGKMRIIVNESLVGDG